MKRNLGKHYKRKRAKVYVPVPQGERPLINLISKSRFDASKLFTGIFSIFSIVFAWMEHSNRPPFSNAFPAYKIINQNLESCKILKQVKLF